MGLRKTGRNGRIFFVDKDLHVLERAREVLGDNGFSVVCFSDGREGLDALRSGNCDLVVAAIGLTEPDGIELLTEARRIKPWVPVLVVTDRGDVPTAVRAFKAGAAGFLEKPLTNRTLLAGVMDALGPMVASNQRLDRPLTGAEMRVLRLILGAHSNSEIARFLCRSERTIEVHRRHIMAKLGASNIIELVRRSAEKGLISVEAGPGRNRA